MKSSKFKLSSASLFAATLVGLTMTSPLMASAGNSNPGVLPLNSSAGGQSYGKWTVSWWQWLLSVPAGQNPWLDDTTGQFAGVGQSGPVWFLGGSLGNSVERTFTMPSGKFLFLPVNPWIFGSVANDCGVSNPSVACDVPTLRDSAAAAATGVQVLQASIDGTPVADVAAYRALSPEAFSVTLPVGNVLGLPPGTFGPQVADGHWLLIAPLQPGLHNIVVHVIPDSAFGTEFTVTYHITVGTP